MPRGVQNYASRPFMFGNFGGIKPLFMYDEQLIQYGWAKKPFEELTGEELAEVNSRLDKEIRERAWAVGSPVYYGIGELLIAEYSDGRRMILEEVEGEVQETREYYGNTH